MIQLTLGFGEQSRATILLVDQGNFRQRVAILLVCLRSLGDRDSQKVVQLETTLGRFTVDDMALKARTFNDLNPCFMKVALGRALWCPIRIIAQGRNIAQGICGKDRQKYAPNQK